MKIPLFCLATLLLSSLCYSAEQQDLRLNQLQWLGSHNSYKLRLSEQSYALAQAHGVGVAALKYGHPTLTAQLDLGLRHLEIDVLTDPKGALYAAPLMEKWQGKVLLSDAERAQLGQAGFKVMHMPDVDFASHCLLLSDCLQQLRHWSEQHPQHMPVMVLINAKESGIAEGVKPPRWQAQDYQQFDQLLLSALPGKLLTPDQLRQPGLTLRQSVLQHGWPALAQSRGKFLFIFDGQPEQLQLYRQQHASLQGRVMFGNYAEDQPEAAVLVLNDPTQDFTNIQRLSKAGFLIRTRSDEGNVFSKTRFDQALNSGAHIISTDFYRGALQFSATPQTEPQHLFDNNSFVRCHYFVCDKARASIKE
jgi:hypothetical protein